MSEKLSENYTEIWGLHFEGGEECTFNLLPQVAALETELDAWVERGALFVEQGAEVAALEAKLEAMERALAALVIKTKSGQICFRTTNNIPMGMSKKQERIVAAAQEEQE
jgi:hypothetical protein